MISVCIATHNGSKYIKGQIDSIIGQLSAEDEIIISDDGSTDNTCDLINSYKSRNIILVNYKQSINFVTNQLRGMMYASKNFENALSHAKGDIIVLCDQDDIWYPNKIARIKEVLLDNDIMKHNMSIINADGVMMEKEYYTAESQRNRGFLYLLHHLPFRGCCLAFKRWILDAAMPFPKNCLQHDSWIGMIARIHHAKYSYIEEPLLFHRIHGENASELEVPNSLQIKIKYRLQLLYNLFCHQYQNYHHNNTPCSI